MSLRNRLALIAVMIAVLAVAFAPSVQAQVITTRTDQASYSPSGSGTLFITIVNDSPTDTLEIRNLTIYFPWAGFVDGKWAAGSNVTYNLAPYKVLTTSVSPGGGNIFTYNAQFTIPSWFGRFSGGSSCPDSTPVRYGIYSSCVLLGFNGNGLEYQGQLFSVSMAVPTYRVPSLTQMILPTATFIVLVIGVVLLFMAYTSLKRWEAKKK